MENVILHQEKISLKRSYIGIKDTRYWNRRIPYKEIILGYLKVWDRESGGYYKPEITEVTRDMDGDLILYDYRHCCFHIRTDLVSETAGAMLGELTMHAPYILAGGQEWFDEYDEKQFAEIGKMVEIMQGCI